VEPLNPKEETGFDEAYLAFARTLRIWFVAYGIGVPVLILNQDKLLQKLLQSGHALGVARFFLAGVGVQILTAIVYKAAMWHPLPSRIRPLRQAETIVWLL